MPADHRTAFQSLLREQITLEQAKARYAELDRELQLLSGSGGEFLQRFHEEILPVIQPGDELWIYSTDPESWANLCGESGLVLTRDGQPVVTLLELMN